MALFHDLMQESEAMGLSLSGDYQGKTVPSGKGEGGTGLPGETMADTLSLQ